MNKRRAGIVLVVIGAVLLLAALLLYAYNLWEDAKAGSEAADILVDVQTAITEGNVEADEIEEFEQPDEQSDVPPMPVTNIKGYDYIGYVNIPDLQIELPVMADWDYSRLQKAPCRQFGTTYGNDLVIAAHNYDKHFGRIGGLTDGAEVTFTDMDGIVTTYAVREISSVGPYEVEKVTDSPWDLILYTCTYGGRTRIVVGCERME